MAASEQTVEYRRLVGSSLLLLVLVAIGVFALRLHRLCHRHIGGVLLAGAVAFVPLVIPQVPRDRVLVPVLSIAHLLPNRYVTVVSILSLDMPKAPDGEVWSHASLEAARPAAVARIAESTRYQHEHRPIFDDDAVARRQLVLSFALTAAEAFIFIAVRSRQRLSRWHPAFRSHFPTLWPKDRLAN